MQKARFLSVAAFAIVLSIFMPFSVAGQYTAEEGVGKELRPFDFSDGFYKQNGVDPEAIINRRSGLDKYSVVDFIDSNLHRNVRITGMWPIDGSKGEMFFEAPLGELAADGFTRDETGAMAISTAHRYPYYVFPSTVAKNVFRQAAVAETSDGYFEKNPLGLSVIVSVQFTAKALSKEGQKEIEALIGKNGMTLDGNLAIRRVAEIDYLNRRGLVAQEFWNSRRPGSPAYMMKQVIQDPRNGAISPDSFLMMTLDRNQKPLRSEMMFVDQFECLQKFGSWCG